MSGQGVLPRPLQRSVRRAPTPADAAAIAAIVEKQIAGPATVSLANETLGCSTQDGLQVLVTRRSAFAFDVRVGNARRAGLVSSQNWAAAIGVIALCGALALAHYEPEQTIAVGISIALGVACFMGAWMARRGWKQADQASEQILLEVASLLAQTS